MKTLTKYIIFTSFLHASFLFAQDGTNSSGSEEEYNVPIWTPGKPLLDEDAFPQPERDDTPQGRDENEYSNCIDNELIGGANMAEALEACKEKKGANGDVGDFLNPKVEQPMFNAVYEDENGQWVDQFLTESEMIEILRDLQNNKIRLKITEREVQLIQLTSSGAKVLQSFSKSNWTKLFDPKVSPAEQAARDQKRARQKLRGLASVPIKFLGRRIAGIFAGTPVFAGDACHPYSDPKAFARLFRMGQKRQMEEVKMCNQLPRMLQVIQQNLHK